VFHVRTTQTSSSSTAVQVVRYEGKKTIIVKHVGSGKSKSDILKLKTVAYELVKKLSSQPGLFDFKDGETADRIIQVDKSKYLGINYTFIYEVINHIFHLLKFDSLNNKLMLDLVLMRIIEPASKLRSIELLGEMFGIVYSPSNIYRQMQRVTRLKEKVEELTIDFAKRNLKFDFTVVFYDVTTLYFETDKSDDLRKYGYSKDNKFNQPQILIALIVNSDGFPVSSQIFEGNTFEGHTFIPAIVDFKSKHKVLELTVVADAAMISEQNIKKLVAEGLGYIVGARLGNISQNFIKLISHRLKRKNGKTARFKTANGYLVCDFSKKRYTKDLHELKKQIRKAKELLKNPDKILKRNKFVKHDDKTNYRLHRNLIKKASLLLGIKGYYTNLEKSNKFVIRQYHYLWSIEKDFRISKSDLKVRPIYHFKIKTIQSHILICFMALVVVKYMEIKTGKSTQKIIRLLKNVTDARILDLITNEEIVLRSEISDEIKKLLKQMRLPY